ncbi:hypothetical protein GCM10027417_22380 [Glutamicibacter endophyticus]
MLVFSLLLGTVAVTQAAVTLSFTGSTEVSAVIDIAQDAHGKQQHDSISTAKILEQANPGVPIAVLSEEPVDWPKGATASVPIEIHNLSTSALVSLALSIEAESTQGVALDRFRFGVRVDGKQLADHPVLPGGWFSDHPHGLPVQARLDPREHCLIEVAVWLGPEATMEDYAQRVNLPLRVTAQTLSGENISMKVNWP